MICYPLIDRAHILDLLNTASRTRVKWLNTETELLLDMHPRQRQGELTFSYISTNNSGFYIVTRSSGTLLRLHTLIFLRLHGPYRVRQDLISESNLERLLLWHSSFLLCRVSPDASSGGAAVVIAGDLREHNCLYSLMNCRLDGFHMRESVNSGGPCLYFLQTANVTVTSSCRCYSALASRWLLLARLQCGCTIIQSHYLHYGNWRQPGLVS